MQQQVLWYDLLPAQDMNGLLTDVMSSTASNTVGNLGHLGQLTSRIPDRGFELVLVGPCF